MYGKMQEYLSQTLAEIKEAGLYKEERLIESAQQAAITVKGKEVLNFCANNYLGLSNHPRLIKASQEMMNNRGYGMSSVRFICGTQDIHKELEAAISDYFQDQLIVEQGEMQVIEGGDNALVIMETVLRFPDGQGGITEMSRRATYVFRQESDGRWLCTIDNSYGTSLLDTGN